MKKGKENVKILRKKKARDRNKKGKIIHFLRKKETRKKVEDGKYSVSSSVI
jgi:hypothetical protein